MKGLVVPASGGAGRPDRGEMTLKYQRLAHQRETARRRVAHAGHEICAACAWHSKRPPVVEAEFHPVRPTHELAHEITFLAARHPRLLGNCGMRPVVPIRVSTFPRLAAVRARFGYGKPLCYASRATASNWSVVAATLLPRSLKRSRLPSRDWCRQGGLQSKGFGESKGSE